MNTSTLILDLPMLTPMEASIRTRILQISFTDTFLTQEILDMVFTDRTIDNLPKKCSELVDLAFLESTNGRSLGRRMAEIVYADVRDTSPFSLNYILHNELLFYLTRLLNHFTYHPYLPSMVSKIPNFTNRLAIERTIYEDGIPSGLICTLVNRKPL